MAESVIFAEMLDTLSRAKGAGIPPLRRGRCRLTGGIALSMWRPEQPRSRHPKGGGCLYECHPRPVNGTLAPGNDTS